MVIVSDSHWTWPFSIFDRVTLPHFELDKTTLPFLVIDSVALPFLGLPSRAIQNNLLYDAAILMWIL